MPKSYSRLARVGELIQNALAKIIQEESAGEHLSMLTITDVRVSPDLSFAKVFVSVLEDDKAKEAIAELNQSSRALRYELAHAIKLRIVPELKFIYDDSAMRGNRISSLINQALKNNKSDHE